MHVPLYAGRGASQPERRKPATEVNRSRKKATPARGRPATNTPRSFFSRERYPDRHGRAGCPHYSSSHGGFTALRPLPGWRPPGRAATSEASPGLKSGEDSELRPQSPTGTTPVLSNALDAICQRYLIGASLIADGRSIAGRTVPSITASERRPALLCASVSLR